MTTTSEIKQAEPTTTTTTLPLLSRTNHRTLQRWSESISPLPDDESTPHTPPPSTSHITATDIITAATTPRQTTQQDPLAMLDAVVDGTRDREREQLEQARQAAITASSTSTISRSLFPVNHKLNQQIILWKGDLCTLDTDVIVNTTNERMNDYGGISGRIFHHAGPTLAQECATLSDGCPTGDAVLLGGGNLYAKHVILTVGPRYSLKYQTAAENALHGCYRRSMELLKDAGLTSIGFCVVNTERKGYPKKSAAHIACRTLRRFLQLFGDGIESVVLAMDTQQDYEIYEEILPLYFPRTRKEQEFATELLPQDTGNELGETVIEERKIRISTMPGTGTTPALVTSTVDVPTIITDLADSPVRPSTPTKSKYTKAAPSKKSSRSVTIMDEPHFSDMQENPDDIRAKQDAERPRAEQMIEEQNREYAAYLRRAREEDLKDMAARNFCYTAGTDGEGRPIVVLVGRNFPGESEHLDRALLYLILTLDSIVINDYNLIYFHAGIESHNKPPMKWLKLVYGIFNRKYKKNLKRLFIVHPSIWVKMVIWFVSPFVKKKFWKKLQYAPKLMDLYEFFDAKQLRVPVEITKYDTDLHGSHYIANYEADKLTSNKEDDKL